MENKMHISKKIKFLLGFLCAASVFSIVYRFLSDYGNDRSIALFIGVPLLLGWMIGLMKFEKPIGIAVQYTTLILCIVAPLLGEGLICILLISPIVYPLVIGTTYAISKIKEKNKNAKLYTFVVILPFLYTAFFENPNAHQKIQEITSSIAIDVPPQTLWKILEDMNWDIPDNRPFVLRLGYPVPKKIISEKSAIGNKRRIVFNTGTIVGTISRFVPNKSLSLELAYENAHGEFFNRWVNLIEMHFELSELEKNKTLLTHKAIYRRKLPLEFYFSPIEKITSRILENYLLESFSKYIENHATRISKNEINN